MKHRAKQETDSEKSKERPFSLELRTAAEQDAILGALGQRIFELTDLELKAGLHEDHGEEVDAMRGLYIRIAKHTGKWEKLDILEKLSMGLYEEITIDELQKQAKTKNNISMFGRNWSERARYFLDIKLGNAKPLRWTRGDKGEVVYTR